MGLELAEIFRCYGIEYDQQRTGQIPSQQRKAMRAIVRCRTEALGGHIYQCQYCEERRYSYHSCRNRHCPKCQHENGQEWLVAQQALLLNAPYFLLTFTLPAECIKRSKPNTLNGVSRTGKTEYAAQLKRLMPHT